MVLKFRNVNTSDWSPSWKRSKQPRKQRKYIINAPLHVRRKMMAAHLSKELREVLKMRSIPVRVGDYVKITRGKFAGKEGHIVYVDTKRYRVYVDIAYINKKNGEKSYYPIHPSNLLILKLNMTDKKRGEALKAKKNLKDEDIEKLMSMSIVNKEDLKAVYEIYESLK